MRFQTKLIHELIDFYLDMHAVFKLSRSDEAQLTALNFLIDTLILASGSEQRSAVVVSLGEVPRAKEFIMELIQNVAGRIKGQDSTVQEQFQCLLTLFTRDINTMLSETGIEFLVSFGASHDQNVVKEMRKLYISFKQRDSLLLESKKSILYSLIMKAVVTLHQGLSDVKVMRIADATVAELQKEMA